MGWVDLVQWHKRQPGKHEVVNLIPGTKKQTNKQSVQFEKNLH